jgi:hypothetical protein
MEIEEKLDQIKITDEDLILQIQKEYDEALEYRRSRVAEWQANEDMLYLKKPKTISKRANINLNLMHGFVYTFLSKIKAPTIIKFEHVEAADTRKAKKVQALFEVETSQTKENWDFKDLSGKKSGMVSGRVIEKIVTEYPYRHRRQRVDHYDFLIDPKAGGFDIENADYMGQDNIFKSKKQLRDGDYNQKAVEDLIQSYSENRAVDNDNKYGEKDNRFAIIGLDPNSYLNKGGKYKLLDWYTTVEGIRYNCFLDLERKIILKRQKLEEVVGIHDKDQEFPRWVFRSWAYYPDEFNFWSISPMEVVREVFQTRNVVINQAVDNNEDQNNPAISYDPQVYKDPSKLERTRPGRLIATAPGTRPDTGMYIHPVNSIYDPVKLNDVLENIIGKVIGVTAESNGQAQGDQKVGIYYGNQSEIADRMTLFERSYSMFNIGLAQLYLDGLRDKMEEKIAVKIIGEDGVQTEELLKEDLTEFDIKISGGLTEAQNDAVEKKEKREFLAAQIQNPLINPKWVTEQQLILQGYDTIDVKKALSKEDINEDLMAEASQDIQKLLLGEKVTPNPKATPEYMQKILDFYQKTELKADQEKRFVEYLNVLQEPAANNVVRNASMQAQKDLVEQVKQTPIIPQDGQPLNQDLQPNTTGNTIAQASQMSTL